MVNIGNYLAILRSAKNILNSYSPYPEANDDGYVLASNIYECAFAALLQEGFPYERRGNMVVIATDGAEYSFRTGAVAETRTTAPVMEQETSTKANETIRSEEGTALETEPGNSDGEKPARPVYEKTEPDTEAQEKEHLPENDSDEAGPEEAAEDGIREEEPAVPDEEESEQDEFMEEPAMPDYTEEPSGVEIEPAEEEPPFADDEPEEGFPGNGEEEELPIGDQEEGDIPEDIETEANDDIPEEGYMPSTMKKEGFTMAVHKVIVKRGGNVKAGIIESMPLLTVPGKDRILVGTFDGKKSGAVVSRKGKSSVAAELFGIRFIVSGKTVNGKYISECELSEQYRDMGYEAEINSRMFNGKGHIVIEDDEKSGLQIHVLPFGFENVQGAARFFYFLTQGPKEKAGAALGEEGMRFELDGEPYRMIAAWDEGSLVCHVREIS